MHILKLYFNKFIAKYTILFFVIIIIFVIFIGTIAFYNIEWWSFFNSLYFTSVTMSTIGYGDIVPLTHAGKLIAMFYGFMGAPLFVWFTWIAFQSKIQKMLKTSIHTYHKEAKEAEDLAIQLRKENKVQNKKIKKIEQEVEQERK